MDLIVETDIGRDPDDFLALCYLIEAGVNIRLVTISPGDRDQVALTRFLLDECGFEDTPIGVGRPNRDKRSVGSIQRRLLERHGKPTQRDPDGAGGELMHQVLQSHSDCQLFCCGPLDSVGALLEQHPGTSFSRVTMQGGFIAYHALEQAGIEPSPRLAKFEGMDFCMSFNPHGNIRGTHALLQTPLDEPLRLVSKNVCHGMAWGPEIQQRFEAAEPRTRAGELMRELMASRFEWRDTPKKIHDPLAAVLHLHPELGQWARGQLLLDSKRGCSFDIAFTKAPHRIIGAVDRQRVWDHLIMGN